MDRPLCDFEVDQVFSLFVRLDRCRPYTLLQGMKKPSYHSLSSRNIIYEMEIQACDLDHDYVVRLIDAMDVVRLERLNS